MPPFQNPDETSHMLRADQIAHLGLLGTRFDQGYSSGGVASPGIMAAASRFDGLKAHPERRLTSATLTDAAAIPWGEPSPQSFANTAIYPPVLYLQAAAAIAIGRALGLGIVPTLKLARLATASVCVLIGAIAIAIAGRGGILILTILCLPMSLELMASLSQDGPMLASSALGAALLWRGAAGRIPRFDLWFVVMCAALGLVVAARPPYLPLALLPLALPRELRFRLRLAGAALILAIGLAWVWIALATSAIDTAFTHHGAAGPQIRALAEHPWRIASLAWDTLEVHGAFYVHSFLGELGWLDTPLPRLYLHAAMVVVALAFLAAGSRPAPLGIGGASIALLGLAGATAAVFLIQYATWTPLGAPVVEGVQGRYFLPIALCLLPVTTLLPRLGPLDRVLRAVVCGFPLVSLAVMIRAILLRYYLQ